jgi:hypothetical protein
MADTVLFMGWNEPVRGREAVANELFSSMVNYLQKAQGSRVIESFEPIFLNPHGGDLNGFFVVRGTRDQIHKLRTSDDFLNLSMQVQINVEGWGVIDGYTGEGVTQQMSRWQRYIPTK